MFHVLAMGSIVVPSKVNTSTATNCAPSNNFGYTIEVIMNFKFAKSIINTCIDKKSLTGIFKTIVDNEKYVQIRENINVSQI